MKSDKMSCSHDEVDILFALNLSGTFKALCINANKSKPKSFPPGNGARLIYQFVYAIKRTPAEDDICGMFLLCSCYLRNVLSRSHIKSILKGEFCCPWAFVQNISFSNKYIGL